MKETKKLKCNKSNLASVTVLALMTAGYAFFLFWKVGVFPNVFLDEGNCMYDSWCMAFYGVDSNLLKNPVYLPGYIGQGQSILYPLLAGLSLRAIGYNLFAYRLPLILSSVLNYVLLLTIVYRKFGNTSAIVTAVVLGTSPYVLTVSRWGMDCNVAPFIASIAAAVLYLGISMKSSGKRTAVMIPGGILLGLTAYSYNVSWMFLPVFVVVLSIWLIRKKKLSFREIILPGIALFVTVIPIMIFAVRSNIPSLNTDVKILWWTCPRLMTGRVKASFISFEGNLFFNIRDNLVNGYNMYLNGSDSLSWNSVGNIGPYFMFVCPFFIVGLITMIRRREDCDVFILSALAAMIPIMMVVTPNYNHWIFIHFPVLLTVVIGIKTLIAEIVKLSAKRVFIGAMITTYALFSIHFCDRYFSSDRYTGWETSAIPIIRSLATEQYDKVYFASDDGNFLYFIRFCLPVSPYEYQKTRDNPYSETLLGTSDHYSNFERIGSSGVSDNSLFIVEKYKNGEYADLLVGHEIVSSFTYKSQQYDVYRFD